MTRLLVSVRDLDEAAAALAGGADLVDVKEPNRGSLGAADPKVVRRIVGEVKGRRPLSVALGELSEDAPAIEFAGIDYAKLGLANTGGKHWQAAWRQRAALWPETIQPIAVAYADWQTADAPAPDDVLHAAVELGCYALLVDTYDKRQGLFDLWGEEELVELREATRRAGLALALAGGLRRVDLPRALAIGPDIIAVRGAVCRGGRTGKVDPQLVRQLAADVARSSPRAVPLREKVPAGRVRV